MAFLKKNKKPYAANKMGQYLSLLVILVVTTFSSWSYSGLLKPICTSGTISGSSASSGKRLLLKSPFQNDWVLSHCHNNPNPSQDSGDDLGNISPDKQIPGGTFTFFHNNHQGSPLAASDHAGELLWQEEYKPYGEKLVKQDATNTIGYTGHQFDRETGLTYMQARYYDPVVGRFMGVDAVGFVESNPMSFNRYAYANNNPYKYVDPDGEFAVTGAILLTYGAVSLAWSVYDTYTTVSGVYSGNITAGEAATNFAVDTAVGLVGGAAAKGGLKLLRKSKLLVSATKGASKVCCFVAGTQVLTKDGYKNIEDVELGELLYSKNVDTGEQDYKPVTQLFKKHRLIYELTVVNSIGESKLIETTDDHPFYVPGKGFVDTIDLIYGDVVETEGNELVVVESVVDSGRYDVTYNFEVADFHTYYATKFNLLVHNCNIRMKGHGNAERTTGSIDEVKQAVAEAGYDPKKLNCAKCKLETSIKNRKAEQRRMGPDASHTRRINQEQQQLDKVNRRLNEL